MNDVFEKIEYSDFPEDIKLIADICGVEAARKLIKALQGINIYFPRITAMDSFIKRYINSDKEKSIKMYARELAVSEQFLKKYF